MTEQGAAADSACRDGAPRGARAPRKGPRAPGPPLPSKPWVPEAWRVAGSRKPGRGGLANLLGASRRSIPLLWEREGKQGDGRSRASEKQSPGAAKRWLFGSVGCLKIESENMQAPEHFPAKCEA